MLKAAIKNLLGHKLRMFLTGFSIILGVSFVSGTYIFTDSIGSTFDNLLSDVFSGVDVTVRPKQDDFVNGGKYLPANITDKIKAVDGVSVYEGSVDGYAQFLDRDEKPIGGQGPPTLGFSWSNQTGLNPLRIAEGDGLAPAGPGEVVMDKATAEANGFKTGDTVKVLLNGPVEEFTIVGIATFGNANGFAGATLAAFEINEARRVFGYPENVFASVDVKAETNVSPDELKKQIEMVLPQEAEAATGAQQSNEQLKQINQGLGFINTALLAFAGIAIFVGSFIIQNTFRIIVSQRSKELALLRAIGANKAQVTRLVLYEAFIISVLASIVGIFAGLFVSGLVRAAMDSAGVGLPDGELTIAPRTVIVSMAVGVVVTLVAALLPAIKASRVSPIEAMRENEASQPEKGALRKRGISGTILTAIGIALLILGLRGNSSQPLPIVGAGVVAIFIGISVIAPIIAVPIAKIIGWPLVRLRGIPARLARNNAIRSPKRTASSAAALMIGVSLISMVSILANSFKAQITTTLEEGFPGDVFVQSVNIGDAGPGTAGFSVESYNTLKSLPELTAVTAIRVKYQQVKLDGRLLDFVAAVDTKDLERVITLGPTEGAYEKLGKGGVLLAGKTLTELGKNIGDTLDMTFAKSGKQPIEIVGTFSEPADFDYLFGTETYFQYFDDTDVMQIIAKSADGYTDEQATQAAKTALAGYKQLTVQDKGELYKTAEKNIDQALGLFWALLGFAVIIAMLGITNTLMLSVSERTREIGMLRAIGGTRSQIRRMIRYESIIISLFGAILGVILGLFFAWALIKALESEGITTYSIPGGQVVMYLILAIMAGIVAAAWPARKAARMNVLKAIYHE
jgi:putative ABC transport system permease protein